MSGVQIEALNSATDLVRCVNIQQEVWGFNDEHLIGAEEMAKAIQNGGIVLGASFGDQGLVGFVMSYAITVKENRIQHSHLLAVLPDFRNRGVGYELKLAQYKESRRIGTDLLVWTFDPLEAKNANLNLNKLGCVARRYFPDFYGASSSILHKGLATDRLFAELEVDSKGSQEPRPPMGKKPSQVIVTRVDSRELLIPESLHLDLEDPSVMVEVPAEFQNLKQIDLELAKKWRHATRTVFQNYMGRDYEAHGLKKTKRNNRVDSVSYVLRKRGAKHSVADELDLSVIPFRLPK